MTSAFITALQDIASALSDIATAGPVALTAMTDIRNFLFPPAP